MNVLDLLLWAPVLSIVAKALLAWGAASFGVCGLLLIIRFACVELSAIGREYDQ
jgi:hypothetical protein